MSQRVFIIGAGRFGVHLATRLSELGSDVTLADQDQRLIQDLAEAGYRTVRLDADDAGDLRAGGALDADVVVVAIGENMQASILCTLILKELGQEHVVARGINDKHAQILTKLGADRVILPARDSAVRLAEEIHSDAEGERVPLTADYQMGQVRLGPRLAGTTLGDAALPAKHGLTPVLLSRTDEKGRVEVGPPNPKEALLPGDVLFVVGLKDDINAFEEKCGRSEA